MAMGPIVFKNQADYDNAKNKWLGAEARRGARQDENGMVIAKDGQYQGPTPFSATPDKDGNTRFAFNPHDAWNYKQGDPDIKDPDRNVSQFYTGEAKKTFDEQTAKIKEIKNEGYGRILDMFNRNTYMQVLMSQNK